MHHLLATFILTVLVTTCSGATMSSNGRALPQAPKPTDLPAKPVEPATASTTTLPSTFVAPEYQLVALVSKSSDKTIAVDQFAAVQASYKLNVYDTLLLSVASGSDRLKTTPVIGSLRLYDKSGDSGYCGAKSPYIQECQALKLEKLDALKDDANVRCLSARNYFPQCMVEVKDTEGKVLGSFELSLNVPPTTLPRVATPATTTTKPAVATCPFTSYFTHIVVRTTSDATARSMCLDELNNNKTGICTGVIGAGCQCPSSCPNQQLQVTDTQPNDPSSRICNGVYTCSP